MAVRLATLDELVTRGAAVVPAGVPLVAAQCDRLRDWVDAGGRLATAHDELLATLGVRRAPAASVSGANVEGVAGPVT